MAGLIIMSFVGFLLIFLGFIMWKFKLAGLIAGYEPDKVKDPEELAKWMGKCLMVNGLIAWLMGFVSYLSEAKNSGLITVMIFVVLSSLTTAIALAGMQRYLK